ncbi:MAG: hypothetical protein Rpha_1847 [Candidatus Ruthia sp. Apha_13_S6]|nr:hypothetical protein [Candidatus Ruthia sp. Apha_13_S6]
MPLISTSPCMMKTGLLLFIVILDWLLTTDKGGGILFFETT